MGYKAGRTIYADNSTIKLFLFFQKCIVTGRKYTYKEVEKKSRNLGAALRRKLKLNKGDVVTVLFPNIPEFPIAALGVLRGGLVCTTVNPIYKASK